MGSNTFPQQQSMGQMQMPQQMAPMQQQDQQSGFAGMYAPQYGAFAPMAGGMAISGGMQGYGGGQSVPNYAPSVANGTEGSYKAVPDDFYITPQKSQAEQDKMMSDYIAANPNAPRGYGSSQSVPNYQVPQIQQQPVAGYGGYAQQPMQQNPYVNQQQSSRQGPQRLY
jgi:hypothetical protein